MSVLKLPTFSGEMPLIASRLLPDMAADAASNVRLNDGILTPIRKSVETGGTAGSVADKSIVLHGNAWLSFATDVMAATGPVATDRLYYTGDGVPKMRVGAMVYDLAIAQPSGALIAAVSGSGSGDVSSRTYVYTWVSDFGEESAPSPASALIDWRPGQTVTLSGFGGVPGGRNITKQRIYRSQTGSSGTYFYFIAERAASAANFIDNVAVDAFQEVLPSADWTAPPSTLSGIIAMQNGMMAAFSGRDVYFCEPWRPHAWPEKYVLTVNSDVMGLAAIGSVLLIMTKGQPYIAIGNSPDTMQMQPVIAPFPCINSRSIVNLGFAACYATNEGLALIKPDGNVSLATEALFSRDDWLAFSPSSIVCGQIGGIYAMFYDTLDTAGNRFAGCVLINVNAAKYLVRSSEMADCVHYSLDNSALYFKRPGETKINRFDAPDGAFETLYWKTKEFWMTEAQNFGAILVDGSAVTDKAIVEAETASILAANQALLASSLSSEVNASAINELDMNGDRLLKYPTYGQFSANIYADGELVRTIDQTGKIWRLPGNRKARKWQIDISSNVPISQIIMAGTIDELRAS